MTRVAAVQLEPRLGDVSGNLDRIERGLRAAAKRGARVIVFPECALTGYAFASKAAATRAAQPLPGEALRRLALACRETKAWAVVGSLEKAGTRIYNTAVLIGPGGLAGKYRKTHLPYLGADRFASPGDLGLPVFKTPFGKIGILICYDGSFPEAPRSMKLQGARLLCLPTNFPAAAEVSCRYAPRVRAHENHMYFVSCDRVGTEAGFRFRGGSMICDFEGRILAEAGRAAETISAELDLPSADRNRVVIQKGRYELDRIAHRRPELYGRLARRS